MLRDRYRQLLTASIDGELNSQQRRLLARLLSKSAEARQLLAQLQADARALRHLPRPALPADLTGPVLHAISERRLRPGHRRIASASSATEWLGPLATWAAAASVLLILGAASYLFFATSLSRPEKNEIAHEQQTPSTQETPPEQLAPPVVEDDAQPFASREGPDGQSDESSSVKPTEVVRNRKEKPRPHVKDRQAATANEASALTDRFEMFQLDRAPDILPLVLQIRDLEKESARKQLRTELLKDRAFRMELPIQNGTKAFDRVQKAARTLRYGLILDKPVQERMKQKGRTNYVLYIEDVTPEEWIRFVQQIGIEDRKSAEGKPAEMRIDHLVLTPMSAQHHKELSTLLGIDPTVQLPRTIDGVRVDPSKPLSDLTAEQLRQSLVGQGGKPRPQGTPSVAKPAEHLILVLAYNPVRSSPGSDEIKRFLENRKPARSGTIRVLLVLRS